MGVEGLVSVVQRMGIRGGKVENLEKRGYGKKMEEESKSARSKIRGWGIRFVSRTKALHD
jgi:hypothetical protein